MGVGWVKKGEEEKKEARTGRVKKTKAELKQQQNICQDGSSQEKAKLEGNFNTSSTNNLLDQFAKLLR